VAQGRLQHFRIGLGRGGIRVSEEQINAYLQSREAGDKRAKPPPVPKPPSLKNLSLS